MTVPSVIVACMGLGAALSVAGSDSSLAAVDTPLVPQQDSADNKNSDQSNDSLLYLADIRVHSAKELKSILTRIDQLRLSSPDQNANPVVFLLHGDEARTLFRANYQRHKSVVDLAAKLSAFGMVDIKVCEAWAERKGLERNELQPFVSTVPFVPAEKQRLISEQGYVYF